jgi:hypothetical protein
MHHEGISIRQLLSVFQANFSGCKINGVETEAFSDNRVDDDHKHGHKRVTLKAAVTRISNIANIADKWPYCKITI